MTVVLLAVSWRNCRRRAFFGAMFGLRNCGLFFIWYVCNFECYEKSLHILLSQNERCLVKDRNGSEL